MQLYIHYAENKYSLTECMHILCLVHDEIARVFAFFAVDGDDDKLSKGTKFR